MKKVMPECWKRKGGKGGLHIYEHVNLPFLLENKRGNNYTLFNMDTNEIYINISMQKVDMLLEDYKLFEMA